MASNTDILVNFQGVDNVSPVAQQIQGSMGQMGGGIRGALSELGGIFSGLNGLVMGAFGGMGLSTFKNMTYGLSVAREEVKGLFQTVAGESKEADALWSKMDELTNQGYVQLDDLTQAVNVFGMSTGTGLKGMQQSYELINDIGNRAIQMGYDGNRQLLLMQSVGQGLNGNMRMLNVAFGITKDKLKDLGWKGDPKDVEGYVNALQEYLNTNADMSNLLDSTQGKVVTLQKRFRIAGREIGNSFKPVIDMLLDGVTQLNAQSDDALAKIIILSTGVMSAVASILPTLSPLIQTYEFLERRVGGSGLLNGIRLFDGSLKNLTPSFMGASSSFNTYFATPVINYLKNVVASTTAWIRLPIKNVLTEWMGYVKNFGSAVKTYMIPPFLEPLDSLKNKLGQVTNKFTKFALDYGNLGTKQNIVEKLMGKGIDPTSLSKNADVGMLTNINKASTSVKNLAISKSETAQINKLSQAYRQQAQAVSVNNMRLEASNILHGYHTSALMENAIATEGLTFAEMGRESQQAINSITTLYNAGVINAETLEKEYNAIVTAEQTASEELGFFAKIKKIGVTIMETIATNGLSLSLWSATIAEYAFLLPIVLIVGAIVGLILVIYELGRQLGWWTTWGEVIDAITSGLQRLWDAFINNPNVQGFISDLQGGFGQLWGVITDVALAILNIFGIEDNGEEVDFVQTLIDAMTFSLDIMGKVVNGLKWLEQEFHVFSTIASIITFPIRLIVDIIRTIYCIIWGCSPGVIPALRKLEDVFRTVFGGIISFIGNPVGYIVDQFNNLLDVLGPVGDVIRQAIQTALPVIASVLKVYINTVGRIIGTINDMLTGKISAKEGITRLISIIRPLLLRIYQIVREIMGRIIRYMVQSALNMVNGFVNNLLSLPRRVLGIFTGLINSLKQLPSQLWNTAVGLGQDLYNGVDSTLRSWTGGTIGLPHNEQQAQSNAQTVKNANKNYNNTRKSTGHTIHVHEGAIQMDARNLTTKESQQVMINALHGLKSMALTKQPQGTK